MNEINNMSDILEGRYIALDQGGNNYQFDIKKDGSADLNGSPMDVKIETENDGMTYIKYKNRKYPIEIIEKNQNKYHILINNVSYSFSVETPTSYRRKKFLKKKNKGSKEKYLYAPMPGKIVDILIEEGNEVKAGDAVIILEAMKMQNEIAIIQSGKIKQIKVQPGDNVMKDDILIELDM